MMMFETRLAVCLLAVTALGLAAQTRAQGEAHPVVRTEAGLVEGTVENGMAIFKGVSFAQPPAAPLRWRAPQLPKPWAGVKKANQYAPACEQVSRANPALGIPALP